MNYNRKRMNLIDSIRQLIYEHMPRQHLAAASILFFSLLIILTFFDSKEGVDTTSIGANDLSKKIADLHVKPELLTGSDSSLTSLEQTQVTLPDLIEPAKAPLYITTVKSGDNLSLIFDRAGLSPQDVYKISNSGSEAKILSNLFPGYTLEFDILESREINTLAVIKNPLESYKFTLNNEAKYDIEYLLKTPDIEQIFKEANIQDSLFMAAQKGGISAPITMEIAGIFGGVIDFLLDTRTGDSFNVLYEEKYIDDQYIGDGSIQVAQFTNQGETFTALRYINREGEVGFYNPEGESMRKAFLKNPVDFTRISSAFNPSRKHPILNTIRAHKGTDYAAPRGTPVVATSDGKIAWASRNGSFGKLVVIQHGDQFETKYAHLADYAKGIKKGARVRQGQIVGYVGTTGSATGPHLHYEFLMNGVHRNSRTIHKKLPKAESIPQGEMQRFKEQAQILLTRLESYTATIPSLAQNTATPVEQE